jgi:hypothetical protein
MLEVVADGVEGGEQLRPLDEEVCQSNHET